MEVNWLCHLLRGLHHWNCPTLDTREIAEEGLPEDRMVEESGEGNEADGKDFEPYSNHGRGLSDVEGYNAALHTTQHIINGHTRVCVYFTKT